MDWDHFFRSRRVVFLRVVVAIALGLAATAVVLEAWRQRELDRGEPLGRARFDPDADQEKVRQILEEQKRDAIPKPPK